MRHLIEYLWFWIRGGRITEIGIWTDGKWLRLPNPSFFKTLHFLSVFRHRFPKPREKK